MNARALLAFPLAACALAGLVACGGGGGSSPTGPNNPGTSSVTLASADVLVGGASVNGMTIAPGSGNSTLFTCTLRDPADHAMITRMQMDYPVRSGMGMMGGRDTVTCHDDGLDGDEVAGDGVYTYMDMTANGTVGVHSMSCPNGTYSYAFRGTDQSGRRTNSLTCTVTLR